MTKDIDNLTMKQIKIRHVMISGIDFDYDLNNKILCKFI